MSFINYNNRGLKIRLGVIITLSGFLIFLLGADPDLFGLNRSPVVGFVQSATFTAGLGILCLGGFIGLKASRQPGEKLSIAQDIGLRLIATGYLISLVSGLADVFGFGTQTWPVQPFFGPWQAAGVVIGEIIIAVGFLLYIPFTSSDGSA
ncbi:MAG: hypothetical protein U5K99_01485 [Anaerolineales bacterium]|nr:hypothetical protein [Anaerolineales bacterium]